ncbi:MAG: hypothetical protein LC737_10685, partial [Chloroflexi bacterium]|nr:hypothetical protein [Chloroflexota bacterium]
MHARNRRLFAMLLLLFACGPISPLGPSSSETDATLETQKAEVVFQPQSAAGETIPIGTTRVARQGDKIDVKPQGEALLKFADLLVVDIFHDSEVQLKYAGVDPSAPLLIQFLLNNGSVFNTITPQARAAQR